MAVKSCIFGEAPTRDRNVALPRRVPKVLAEELLAALPECRTAAALHYRTLTKRSEVDVVGLLQRFRNYEFYIAGHTSSRDGLTIHKEGISARLYIALRDLDRVYQKWHARQQPGGVADWVDERALLELSQELLRRRQQDLGRRKKRSPLAEPFSGPIDKAKIETALRKRDYANLGWGLKVKVRGQIAKQFGVGERTVSTVVRIAGLKRRSKRAARKKSLAT